MRPQSDIDAENHDEKALDQLSEKGGAEREFVSVIRGARKTCRDTDLNADFDEHGNAHFTRFQTAKAVRHTREDAAASLMFQVILSKKLDRNRNLILITICMLLYLIVR